MAEAIPQNIYTKIREWIGKHPTAKISLNVNQHRVESADLELKEKVIALK